MKNQNKQTKNTSGQSQKKGTKSPSKQQRPRGPKGMGQLQAAPVSYSRSVKTFSPSERAGKLGSRTIKFKEFVQDIAGSVAFATTTFACNPGLANLFAWFSGQALFYQEYTVIMLRFCFETEKATSLSGKVMFAFLQDSSDPAPASKQEMLENLLKESGAVWQPFCLAISMANFPALGKSRFVRSGNLAANLDVKTYDIGQLVVATQGMADTTLVGELYIEYEIEVRTPLQSVSQLAASLSSKITGVTPSQTSMFGAAPTIVGGLDILASVNTLTFNRVGQYILVCNETGTGMQTASNPTITGTATTQAVAGNGNAAANVGTLCEFFLVVTVTARGQTVIIDNTTNATTITASFARIAFYAAANG
jgi:hypothetical protein